MLNFEKKVLFVGFGSVAQCTLPVLLKHIHVPYEDLTVIDFEDQEGAFGGVDGARRSLRAGADHSGESGGGVGKVPCRG